MGCAKFEVFTAILNRRKSSGILRPVSY